MTIDEGIGHLKRPELRLQVRAQEKRSKISFLDLLVEPKTTIRVHLHVEEDVEKEEK